MHLLGFGPPIAALFRVDPPGEGEVLVCFGMLLALYGATRAARAVTSGVPVLLGPILAAGGFLGWLLLSARLDLHQAEVSVAPRGALLGALGLVGAVWLDARFGAWGAGLRRGAIAAAFGLGLGAPALGAVGELGIGWLGSPGSWVLDFDATRVLRTHWRGEGKLTRQWFTLETSGRTFDLGQADWAALGPGETWAVSRGRWEGGTVRDGSLELVTPEGALTCPVQPDDGCAGWTFRPDGRAAAVRCGEDSYVLDLSAGCERVEAGHVAWLGDSRVDVRDGSVLVGGAEVGRVDSVLRLRVAQGVAVVDALPPTPASPTRSWRITPTSLESLDNSATRRPYVVDGAVCFLESDTSACASVDGQTTQVAGQLIGPHHAYVHATGVVTDLRDGRRWQVPPRTLGRRIRVHDGAVWYAGDAVRQETSLGSPGGLLALGPPTAEVSQATPLGPAAP